MQPHPRAALGVLVAAVVVAAAVVGPVPAGAPSVRADTSRQLLLYERPGTVVTARADGSDYTTIAGDEPLAARPMWSPTGSLVAYVSWDPEGEQDQVRIVNARGTGDRLVATIEGATEVDWAPSGDRLVVAVSGRGLVTMRPDGSDRRQITTAPDISRVGGTPRPAEVANVRWSPDGSRIAFTRHDPSAGEPRHDLLLVDPDGSELDQVTDSPDHKVDGLAWSPDGSRLAFQRKSVHGSSPVPGGVYTVNADGTGRQQVLHTDEHANLEQAKWPAWSPDGSTLALAAGTQHNADLFLVDADGTELRRLVDRPHDVRHPTWSPDGSVIAFAGRNCCQAGDHRPQRTVDVYAVAADGTNLRRVTADGESHHPLFAPSQPVAFEVTDRVAGDTRYATAAAVSRTTYDAAEAVVIARGDAYADALAAAPLAGSVDAPVLLSRSEELPQATRDELTRLHPGRAYVLGGPQALAEGIDQQLRRAGVDEVVRLAGANRFDTARLVAQQLDSDRVYVVQGVHPDPSRGWPDAVAVSALAAHQQAPVLLTRRDRLPSETEQALRTLDPETATVVGGPAAVSNDVADALRDTGAAVDRLAGENRYATSRAVARASVDAGLDGRQTWLATGLAFPDALADGPAAAANNGVLLLTHGRDLDHSPQTLTWVDNRAGAFERLVLLGGPAAIAETPRRLLERAAR